ncbi:MAG: FkbM family methyltransferase [Aulosira sp. ZfuVER01]|nr:FkbM family methyltransferase [Aulosira sp. ZfuVER01]MDZ7999165.1 FkbM family methyltransferase [Aulosira sp. DedVER01a]MDZ8051111.1 FkbM family methyltransferase [Aulosira sp. ZfuCHP01]
MKIDEFIFRAKRRIKFHLWQLNCLLLTEKIGKFKLPDGSLFHYPINSAIGQSLFVNNFERSEVEFVQHSLQPGDIVFDIGANGGIYTVIAAKKVGANGHVYAFEPGYRELDLLRHNIAINNLNNVTIIERAVSNKKGISQFAISDDGALNSLAETKHPYQSIKEWLNVEVTTIDDIVKELNLKKIDFIKIDVEGAEKLIFEGAKNLLNSENKLKILFESCDVTACAFDYSTKDFLFDLSKSGLFVYYINADGSILPVTNYDSRFGSKELYNFIAYNYLRDSRELIS